MRRCPFTNNTEQPCPVPDGPYESLLLRPCGEDRYGRNCAAIISQMIVLRSTGSEGLHSGMDDTYGEIVAHYRPSLITIGDAPENIREDVARCRLPLRRERPEVKGGVAVHHFDLTCTLLNNELLDAVNWYKEYARTKAEANDSFDWWVFSESEGELMMLRHPKNTIAEYDQTFHVGSAVLHNAVNPPLLVVEALRRKAERD